MSRSLLFGFKVDPGNFESTTASFATRLNAMANSANAFTNVTRAGFSAMSRVMGGSVGILKQTVGGYAKFDEANRKVAAKMKLTEAEMKKVSAGFTKLGIDTEFTIPAIQEAGDTLAALGTSKEELLPLLKTAADVASVTGAELPVAAEIAKKAMNAFGLAAKDSAKLSTLLIQSATGSAADIIDIGEALKKAGAPAKLLGNSLLDIVPAIQVMKDTGQEAGTAGRALRSAFASLLKPSDEAVAALARLGLANAKTGEVADEINPKLSRLPVILKALGKAGLDADAGNRVFGKNFGTIIAGLANYEKGGKNATQVLAEYRDKLTDQAEVAQKVATVQSGLGFEMKQIGASFEAAKIKIGELITKTAGLGPVFSTARQAIGGALKALNSIDPAKFKDVTFRVIQPGNLIKVFETAVNGLLPSFLKVIPPAFFFGVRQMVTFMPLVAQVFAKGTVDLLRVSLIAVARGAGVAFATVAGSMLSVAVGKISNVFADLVGNVSSDWAEKIRSSAAAFTTGIDTSTESWTKSIKEGSKVADENLKGVTDALLKVNVKDSLKGGEVLADSFGLDKLKDVLGAATDAMATFVKAQRSLADDLAAQRSREVEATARRQMAAAAKLDASRASLARLVVERSSVREFGRKAQVGLAEIDARIKADKVRMNDPVIQGTKRRELEFAEGKVAELNASIQELKRTIAQQQAQVVQVDQRSQTIYGAKNPESVGRSRARAQTSGGLSSAGEAR